MMSRNVTSIIGVMLISILSESFDVRLAIQSPSLVVLRPEGKSFESFFLTNADDFLHLSCFCSTVRADDHRG